MSSAAEQWPGPRTAARLAGFFYLVFIATFALASYARSTFIVSGDATATTEKIMSSPGLLRAAFMSEALSALFFVLAAWSLYVLLRPVNRSLALLFFSLNLCGVVIESSNLLNLLAPLQILNGAGYMTVFQSDQLQALAMSSLNLYANGIMVAQMFFGTWLLPLGYLLYRSGLVPRVLGILILIDFFGVLIWFFQFFLLPAYPALSYPGLAASFVAELSLALWLLVVGVRD